MPKGAARITPRPELIGRVVFQEIFEGMFLDIVSYSDRRLIFGTYEYIHLLDMKRL